MEFKITKKDFLEGLSQTQGVVEKKNTMPVLSNVLLEAEKQGLKISATDLPHAQNVGEEIVVSNELIARLKEGK